MASVKLGATVVGVSGTVGGVTYARNKSGTYGRVWSSPPKSCTEWQGLARGQMARWGSVWRALSAGDKSDWDLFAASPPETDYDRFGAVVLRSGFAWLCRLNQRRALITSTPISLAPPSVVQVIPVLTGFGCQTPTGTPGVTYFAHGAGEFLAGEYAVSMLSLTPSVGVTQQRRGFTLVSIAAPFGTLLTYITPGTLTKYGWWPAGWLATLHVYRQNADGIRSAMAVRTCVVSA